MLSLLQCKRIRNQGRRNPWPRVASPRTPRALLELTRPEAGTDDPSRRPFSPAGEDRSDEKQFGDTHFWRVHRSYWLPRDHRVITAWKRQPHNHPHDHPHKRGIKSVGTRPEGKRTKIPVGKNLSVRTVEGQIRTNWSDWQAGKSEWKRTVKTENTPLKPFLVYYQMVNKYCTLCVSQSH